MSNEGGDPSDVSVQMHFVGGDELPILYASNVFIRHEEGVFLVSFAQAHGPYEVRPDLQKLVDEGIPSRIVTNLAIPPNRWKEILEVAVRNYDSWVTLRGGIPLDLADRTIGEGEP